MYTHQDEGRAGAGCKTAGLCCGADANKGLDKIIADAERADSSRCRYAHKRKAVIVLEAETANCRSGRNPHKRDTGITGSGKRSGRCRSFNANQRYCGIDGRGWAKKDIRQAR